MVLYICCVWWICLEFYSIYLEEYIHSKRIKVYSSISVNKWWSTMCSFTLFIIEYTSSFILGKLSLEKTPLNLGSWLKYLINLTLLKGLRRTKNFYPYDLCYFILFHALAMLIMEEIQLFVLFLLSWLLFQI